MAVELRDANCTQRLADQLQTLSEVAEAITFRLLELEERLVAQELRLEGHSDSQGSLSDDMELRLGDTEDRLSRIEGLLKGIDRPEIHHQLHSVITNELPYSRESLQDSFLDESLPEPSFIEEEEQPFLDELCA
ncbi:MAG: hypothetical protein O2839_06830 [Cyanobacteria bacterium]|nr:hypothetical protein [Cyanobacteriota bacterium]MDA1246628.1 hypothetical protein [Cyanobacteriota bacterium]